MRRRGGSPQANNRRSETSHHDQCFVLRLGKNFNHKPSSTASVNAIVCLSSTPPYPSILSASSTVNLPSRVPTIVAACTALSCI